MDLGYKLKQLRNEKKITLEELSKMANVAKATLSRIENGQTPGTLKTHLKICEALKINIKELYLGTKILEGEVFSVEAGRQNEVEQFTYDEKTTSIILTSGLNKKNMLPQLLIFEANGKTHLEQNPSGTEKFLFGLEGEFEVKVAEQSYFLKKGGTLYFRSSLPHIIINKGNSEAKCLSVTSPVAL